MKLHRPVRWKEGLFLKPQHFQQQEIFIANREHARFEAFEAHAWGLQQLSIDEDALQTFQLTLDKVRAVLPDGTLVDVPGNASVASRPFETSMTEVGKPLDIYLGIRTLEGNGPYTLASSDAAADARHAAAQEEIYDLDAGRDPITMERLNYNLRIFVGDEAADGYAILPIARLKRTGDAARPVEYDSSFSPPALQVCGSPVIQKAARSVVERLTSVLRDLGQERGRLDPEPLVLYYALSGSLPVLREMSQRGEVHPRHLYYELARLAGALFYRDREGRSAEEVPLYDHRDPGPVFLRVRDLIYQLSEIVFEKAYRRVPMEREGDLYKAVLPQEVKTGGAQMYLEVEASESRDRVPLLIMAAKTSHPGRIEHLRAHALPGVPNEAQPGPPPQLPVGQTASYFRLKHEESEWSTHVLPAGELAAFILNSPADLKINLIVVLP